MLCLRASLRWGGLAFGAPVWGALVPDIVSKDELPSAITLGGVQLNLSGIVGPALGGLLIPLLGAPLLISFNALAFLGVALVIMQWKPRQAAATRLRENFTESFISSLRYARNSQRMKMILFRNLLFSVVISVIPALLPVIALRNCACSPSQLGLIFACVGVGSLAGAVFVLPYLRQRVSTNAIISISMAMIVAVLSSMAVIRQVPALMVSTAFAGVAWALAGSELWVAGQRVMPGWVRGRMNAFLIVLGQGGMALGAILLAAGVAHAGIDFTFAAAAVVALVVLALGHRFSIDFAAEAQVEEAPLDHALDLAVVPDHDDGPITITTDYLIAREDREQFGILMQEVRAAFRRNGAFHCTLEENLNQLGLFRLEYNVSTWAEHLRPQDESPFSLFLFETRARPSSTRRLQPACRSRETAPERSTRRSPSASEGEGRSSKVEQCHIQTVISSKLRILCFNQNRAKCPSRYPFLPVWSRTILSDRSFEFDDVRIQPREAPFDLTVKVGVE